MWTLVGLAFTAAFVGNLGAEIVAEGFADFTAQMYNDWFWSLDPDKAIVDVNQHYAEVDRLIAEAERRAYQLPSEIR